MEMGVIRRMMKKAKRWPLVGAEIKPLREPRSIGRALAHSQKVKLLAKARSRPDSASCWGPSVRAFWKKRLNTP